MRAVVWRSGALGDHVCTLPVLQRLREEAHDLVVVAPARYRALWDGADRWIDSDGPEALRILAGAPLDADLGVAWTPTAAEALRKAGVREVREGTALPTDRHACDHLWAPILDLFGPRDRDPSIAAAPTFPGRPVVIAPGSGGARKRWPLERWRAVARRLDDVLWVGGPVEAEEPGWGVPRRDDLDLRGLCGLARSCRAWLGPDAGPSHLARAVGARTGVVFVGATDPRLWAPPGAAVFVGDPDPVELARWASA